MFVYGHAGTGKTSIVQRVLLHTAGNESQRKIAYVNCTECFTARLIFDRILNGWTGTTPSAENNYSNYGRCDTLSQFSWTLKEMQAKAPSADFVVVGYLLKLETSVAKALGIR